MGITVGQRAVAIDPKDFQARNNLAINLVALGRIDGAREQLREARRLKPSDPAIWHTYGTLLYRQNRFADAEDAMVRARALGYDAYATKNDHALTIMSQGRLDQGLPLYEIRWEELYKNPVWNLGIPEWQGENLDEKRILVHHEQGYGDSLMFVRFLAKLSTRTRSIVLATAAPLVRLFAENFPDIQVWDCESLPPEANAKNFDFHTPMLSMIRHSEIMPKDISSEPYLTVKEPLIRRIPGKFKIGLCWSSGDHGKTLSLRRRVIPLSMFLPLMEIPGVQVISLQKGEESKEVLALGAEALMLDSMHAIEDFYDTARFIQELDLVISVDSAVVHLAGAMGKPVVMLGPYTRCWRWWDSPVGTPWYEDFRIFTQGRDLTWTDSVARVIKYVRKLADSRLNRGEI
jgi:hypothetical protein